jgi:hypothetical protein
VRDDSFARINARQALGAIGRPAIPEILRLLEDSNPAIRASALMAIDRMGPAAAEVIPALQRATKDKDSHVRDWAEYALESVQRKAPGPVPTVGSDDKQSPEAIVKKAIVAHGGSANMRRLLRVAYKTTGTIYSGDTRREYTAETVTDLPHRYKVEMRMGGPNSKDHKVLVLNGDNGWTKVANAESELLSGEALVSARAELYARYMDLLVPLIEEKDIRLRYSGLARGVDAGLREIEVLHGGDPPTRLYLDAKTSLLVRRSRSIRQGDRMVNFDEHFSEFKEIDGAKIPMKLVLYVDGVKYRELVISEVRFLDQIDEALFKKP